MLCVVVLFRVLLFFTLIVFYQLSQTEVGSSIQKGYKPVPVKIRVNRPKMIITPAEVMALGFRR